MNIEPSDKLKISNTKLGVFKDCKRKFKYIYIDNKRLKENRPMMLGSIFHNVAEYLYQWLIDNNDGFWRPFPDNVLTNAIVPSPEELADADDPSILTDAMTVAHRYVTQGMPVLDKYIQVLAVEESFYEPIKTKNGITYDLEIHIDLVYIDTTTGSIWIMDHKTGRLWTLDEAKWDFQLAIYLMLIRKLRYPVQGYIINSINSTVYKTPQHFNKLFRRVPVEKTLVESKNLLKQLNRTVEEIAREEVYPMSPGRQCVYCPFREVCKTELKGYREEAQIILEEEFENREDSSARRVQTKHEFQQRIAIRAAGRGQNGIGLLGNEAPSD